MDGPGVLARGCTEVEHVEIRADAADEPGSLAVGEIAEGAGGDCTGCNEVEGVSDKPMFVGDESASMAF